MKDQYTQQLENLQADYFGGEGNSFDKRLAGLVALKQLSTYFYRNHGIRQGRWDDAWATEEHFGKLVWDDLFRWDSDAGVEGEVPSFLLEECELLEQCLER